VRGTWPVSDPGIAQSGTLADMRQSKSWGLPSIRRMTSALALPPSSTALKRPPTDVTTVGDHTRRTQGHSVPLASHTEPPTGPVPAAANGRVIRGRWPGGGSGRSMQPRRRRCRPVSGECRPTGVSPCLQTGLGEGTAQDGNTRRVRATARPPRRTRHTRVAPPTAHQTRGEVAAPPHTHPSPHSDA